MSSVEEMAEFVILWDLVQDVQFSEEENQIAWKLTANLHMMFSLEDLSAPSDPIGFGLRTLSPNTDSSPGYCCRRRFSQRTNCKKGAGRVILCVCYALWHRYQHNSIFAYSARLHRGCRSLSKHGRTTSFPSRLLVQALRIGGFSLCSICQQRREERKLQ